MPKGRVRIASVILVLLFPLALYGQINSKRLLDNGRNALFFDDYNEAIRYLTQVIPLRKEDPMPYYYRAIAKVQLEDYAGAVADCDSAIAINAFNPQIFYTRGYARNCNERYEEAIKDFDKALEFAPGNAVYLASRSEARFNMKEYDRSLTDAEDAMRHANDKMMGYLYLHKCNLLLNLGDTASVENLADSLIDVAIYPEKMYSLKGFLALAHHEDSIAMNCYNKAINLGDDNANTYYNHAILLQRIYRYDEAIGYLTKAIEICDSSTKQSDLELACQSRFARALVRSEVGDRNNALSDLDTVLLYNQLNDKARYAHATTALQLCQYTTARNDFQQLMKRYPHFVPAYYGAAEACKALGRKRQSDIYIYYAQKIEEENFKRTEQGLSPITDPEQMDTTELKPIKPKIISASQINYKN